MADMIRIFTSEVTHNAGEVMIFPKFGQMGSNFLGKELCISLDLFNVDVLKCIDNKMAELLPAYIELALYLEEKVVVSLELKLSILFLKHWEEVGAADFVVALGKWALNFKQGIFSHQPVRRRCKIGVCLVYEESAFLDIRTSNLGKLFCRIFFLCPTMQYCFSREFRRV